MLNINGFSYVRSINNLRKEIKDDRKQRVDFVGMKRSGDGGDRKRGKERESKQDQAVKRL